MYETEANSIVESPEQIPADILRGFGEFKAQLRSRTVLPWSEHCTECVWPTCYTTCDLYSARPDGGCRRFADGMVRVTVPGAVNSYVLKIRFKQWGKLWTPGNIRLLDADKAERMEKRDYSIGSTLQRLFEFEADCHSIADTAKFGADRTGDLHPDGFDSIGQRQSGANRANHQVKRIGK